MIHFVFLRENKDVFNRIVAVYTMATFRYSRSTFNIELWVNSAITAHYGAII